MSIWEEAKQSVRGFIRVVRLDPDALQDFNLTIDGYWRSFYAAVYTLPIYIAFLMSTPKPKGVSDGKFWLIEAIGYPLGWALWPLLTFYICRSANVSDKYTAYVTVYNWAQIILFGGRLVILTLAFSLFPEKLGINLTLMTLFVVLAAEALIIRLVLGLSWFHALMIEALSFVVGLVLNVFKHLVMIGGG